MADEPSEPEDDRHRIEWRPRISQRRWKTETAVTEELYALYPGPADLQLLRQGER